MAREKDKTAQFTMRLPQDMKDEVQAHAKAHDIDAVTWIRHAIREKLDRENSIEGNENQFRTELRRIIQEEIEKEKARLDEK